MKKFLRYNFSYGMVLLVLFSGCKDKLTRDSVVPTNENDLIKIETVRLGLNKGDAVWILGISWKTNEPLRLRVTDKSNSTEIFNSQIQPNQSKKYLYSNALARGDAKNNWIFIDKDNSSDRNLEFSIEQSGKISKLDTIVPVSAMTKHNLYHKLK